MLSHSTGNFSSVDDLLDFTSLLVASWFQDSYFSCSLASTSKQEVGERVKGFLLTRLCIFTLETKTSPVNFYLHFIDHAWQQGSLEIENYIFTVTLGKAQEKFLMNIDKLLNNICHSYSFVSSAHGHLFLYIFSLLPSIIKNENTKSHPVQIQDFRLLYKIPCQVHVCLS